ARVVEHRLALDRLERALAPHARRLAGRQVEVRAALLAQRDQHVDHASHQWLPAPPKRFGSSQWWRASSWVITPLFTSSSSEESSRHMPCDAPVWRIERI